MMFDGSGRSEGVAWAILPRREEAVQAQQRYNGVALDGQEMHVRAKILGRGAGLELWLRC